jgi:hypothetical protein
MLLGAVLIVGSIVAIAFIKPDDWEVWLCDNPLNKLRKKGEDPIHKNLQDTLQAQANAVAALS